jgi:hypothetical protein
MLGQSDTKKIYPPISGRFLAFVARPWFTRTKTIPQAAPQILKCGYNAATHNTDAGALNPRKKPPERQLQPRAHHKPGFARVRPPQGHFGESPDDGEYETRTPVQKQRGRLSVNEKAERYGYGRESAGDSGLVRAKL